MYHGKRIAVVIRRDGNRQVFYCTAVFEEDEDLGPILRIPLQEGDELVKGSPSFILRGNGSSEYLVEDDQYGCDFRIDLGLDNHLKQVTQDVS